MVIFYIVYFLIFDALLFLLLAKKVKLKKYLLVSLISTLVVFFIIIVSYSMDDELYKRQFIDLAFFSVSIIILHFGSELIILLLRSRISTHVNVSIIEKYLIPLINLVRHWIIYILVICYQLLDIFIFFEVLPKNLL